MPSCWVHKKFRTSRQLFMPHTMKTHEWRTKASVSPGSIISEQLIESDRDSNQKLVILVMSLQNVEIRKHSGFLAYLTCQAGQIHSFPAEPTDPFASMSRHPRRHARIGRTNGTKMTERNWSVGKLPAFSIRFLKSSGGLSSCRSKWLPNLALYVFCQWMVYLCLLMVIYVYSCLFMLIYLYFMEHPKIKWMIWAGGIPVHLRFMKETHHFSCVRVLAVSKAR